MKPHKHAELIKAWADGAEIQWKDNDGHWRNYNNDGVCGWMNNMEYRIKPEPKPDGEFFFRVRNWDGEKTILPDIEWRVGAIPTCNLKLIFDGETGELKSAEVLK